MGAGVSGGSLIYANVFVEAKPELFDNGWPPEITYAELRPYCDKVRVDAERPKDSRHSVDAPTAIDEGGSSETGLQRAAR